MRRWNDCVCHWIFSVFTRSSACSSCVLSLIARKVQIYKFLDCCCVRRQTLTLKLVGCKWIDRVNVTSLEQLTKCRICCVSSSQLTRRQNIFVHEKKIYIAQMMHNDSNSNEVGTFPSINHLAYSIAMHRRTANELKILWIFFSQTLKMQ